MKSLTLIAISLLISANLFAHSGRTDQNGGHWDRRTGTYHYHFTEQPDSIPMKGEKEKTAENEIDTVVKELKEVS